MTLKDLNCFKKHGCSCLMYKEQLEAIRQSKTFKGRIHYVLFRLSLAKDLRR